jgi:hypothetical protein
MDQGWEFCIYVTIYGKTQPKSPGKFGEKREKQKKSASKLYLMSLKLIVFQYNSFIQTSKIYKNHFFPRPTFQNSQNI